MLIFMQNFIDLFIESAPWLLLGFTIAGLIKGLIPQSFLTKQLGGSGFGTTVKAALVGAPLPLCSCGVVPAALGLRKAGASKNATVSFLVATPETGVDSIAVTYALMGPVMAIVRPIAAITSAIISGVLVGRAEQPTDTDKVTLKTHSKADNTSCCTSTQTKNQASISLTSKSVSGLRYAYHDMIRDIAGWLLLGLLFAAAVKTFIPASYLAEWGSGWFAFVIMTLIGIPMYICATASTPIAAGLLMSGVSPGAVLVFMMAGPATNLGTLGIIRREMGRRTLIAYLSGVIIVSFLFGFLLNFAIAQWGWSVSASAISQHEMSAGWLNVGMALLLTFAIIRAKGLQWYQQLNKASSQSQTGCSSSDLGKSQDPKTSCCSKKSAEEPKTSCCSKKSAEEPKTSCCSKKSAEEPKTSCCSKKSAEEPKTSCCSSKAEPENKISDSSAQTS